MTSAISPGTDGDATTSAVGDLQPGVSVIIPSFQGRHHIGNCLRSLAAQTLRPDLFEIIVVLNGPPDATRAVLNRFRDEHPGLDLQVLEMPEPGASRARNAGIAAASRQHTTFVDDDDTVSPPYLEILLAHARPGVVPFAQIVNVDGAGHVDPANSISMQTISHAGRTVHPERVPRALGFNACKLIPTQLVKTVSYDTRLHSGVDVVYFMSLLAHHDFCIHVCRVESEPDARNAVYYRLLRPNSMSRRELSFDFNVVQRLEVISRIDALIRLCDERRRRVLEMTMSAQAGHINRYLETRPDEVDRILETVEAYRLDNFPYHAIRTGLSRASRGR